MRKAFALAVAAILGVSMAAQQPSSRPQTPTFKSSVNAVLLDVRVVDGNGEFVRDLTRDDFRVQEDGANQDLSTFELVDLPFVERTRPTFARSTRRRRSRTRQGVMSSAGAKSSPAHLRTRSTSRSRSGI